MIDISKYEHSQGRELKIDHRSIPIAAADA
jgi:hypothetical protein